MCMDFIILNLKKRIGFTNRVCSNWALRLPSEVTAVQPSGHNRSCHVPSKNELVFNILIFWAEKCKEILTYPYLSLALL